MEVVMKTIAAVAPGLCLLSYFYLKDRYEPEPLRIIVKLFIAGGLAVFPMLIIENVLVRLFSGPWAQAYIVAGLSEEFIKWFLVYYLMFAHKEFDEWFDGIVYGAAIAAGYATIENLFYIFLYDNNMIELILTRAMLPVSAHVLFGVAMGYYLGKAKVQRLRRYVAYSLFLPVLLHGTYNMVINNTNTGAYISVVIYMSILWLLAISKMRKAIRYSRNLLGLF